MSLFDNNIVNDLPKIERIRFWFLKRIEEQIEDWKIEYKGAPEYIFLRNYQLTDTLYRSMADRWVGRYRNDLEIIGVSSTITDVRQKIDRNKFKVIVKILQKGNDDYDIVESDWFTI